MYSLIFCFKIRIRFIMYFIIFHFLLSSKNLQPHSSNLHENETCNIDNIPKLTTLNYRLN